MMAFNKQFDEDLDDKFKDGPYIFMPQRDDQSSKRYSLMHHIDII